MPILGIYASANQGGIAANTSYESIATLNGTGSSGTITFSSIPSTYKHLQIRCFLNSSNVSDAINIRLNGDTNTNYVRHRLIGNGSAASAAAGTTLTQIPALGNAGLPTVNLTYGVCIIDILDYTDTNKNKVVRYLSGQDSNGSGGVDFGSGLWLNSSAVNSVTILSNGASFTTASQVALYGIKG